MVLFLSDGGHPVDEVNGCDEIRERVLLAQLAVLQHPAGKALQPVGDCVRIEHSTTIR
jgi:hypothetical protein